MIRQASRKLQRPSLAALISFSISSGVRYSRLELRQVGQAGNHRLGPGPRGEYACHSPHPWLAREADRVEDVNAIEGREILFRGRLFFMF
jgi:hypothetical protein